MTRSDYYNSLRALARQIREDHSIVSSRVMLSDMRRIYKTYGLKIDLWPYRMKGVRGLYMNDSGGPRVMIVKNLPDEQRIFTMAHELKHHLVDSVEGADALKKVQDDPTEIGAEVFAAELIFPDKDFATILSDILTQSDTCTADMLIKLKRQTRTTLSYAGIVKKAEFLNFISKGSMKGVKWRVLEQELYGEPDYKRIQRYKKLREM